MKNKAFIASLACAFLLVGCSDKYTSVQNKNEVVVEIGGVKVTKAELYNFLLANDGSNHALEAVMTHITDKEIEITAELEAEAKENLDGLKTMLGEGFAEFYQGYGYATEEEYYNKVILYNLKNQLLVEKYIDSKFDTLTLTQKPRKVQLIDVVNKEDAQAAFDAIESGLSFSAVGAVYGKTYKGTEQVVTTASTLDSVVLAIIQTTTTAKRIEEIVETESGSFYLINVVEGDPELFREEAKTALAAITTITDEATRYYLKEAKFEIHDKLLYDQFKQSAPDLIFD